MKIHLFLAITNTAHLASVISMSNTFLTSATLQTLKMRMGNDLSNALLMSTDVHSKYARGTGMNLSH